MSGSFSASLESFGREVDERLASVGRGVGLELMSQALERSPVDTGRFKANNRIGLGSAPAGELDRTDPDGAKTLAEARRVLQGYGPGDRVVLRNNTPYAMDLEYGGSGMAPHGVYRLSHVHVLESFERIVREVRK